MNPPSTYLEIDETTHFAMTTIGDLQRSLKRAGMQPIGRRRARALMPRLLARTGLCRQYSDRMGHFFAPMMGMAEGSLLPYSLAMEFTPYIFDCWPVRYGWWERFFRRYKVKTAFLSIRSAAEYFRNRIERAVWAPEAVDIDLFDSAAPLESRSIGAFAFGRQYKWLHDKIKKPLLLSDVRYVHGEDTNQRPSFGDRNSFKALLADSQVSICIPRSMTHPDEHRDAETVTQRYFESMASGCLIYGHCPAELKDLFGYNPVVEMDLVDPAGQLCDVFKTLGLYQSVADRNLAKMREVGTWDIRVSDIISVFSGREARLPRQTVPVA